MTEVVGPQIRIPVKPERLYHRSPEASHQEVSQQVGARLGLERGFDAIRPGEHVITVQPGQPVDPQPGTQLVDLAVAAAVGVRECHPCAGREQLRGQPLRGRRDRAR